MYFNKNLMKDLDMEMPYQQVYDGTWTLDAMNGMTKQAYRDLNGNGEIDTADQFGYVSMPYYYGIFEPFRVEPYRKDADGNLYYEVYLERTTQVVEKMYDMIFGEGGFLYPSKDADYQDQVLNLFCEGRSLFFYGPMSCAVQYFSNANDLSYGILPMPKYDESQAEYRCYVWSPSVCVPTTITRPELVGACLEQFVYESVPVTTAYIEDLIRGKSTRDTETLEMLDIIYDSQVVDIGGTYLGFDSNFRKVFYCFYDLMSANNNNVASFYEKSEKSILKVLDNLYTKIIENQSVD
jgi:hypothetical protein